jgi:hypothetical protein
MNIPHFIKLFNNRKYKAIKVHNHKLVIDPHFDHGLREYYIYVTELLIESILGLPLSTPATTFVLAIPDYYSYPKTSLKKIAFQVEHTLVKPGGRGAESALLGKTKIPNTEDLYTVRIQDLPELLKNDLIIEYSRPNIKHIRDSKLFDEYLSQVCLITPTLYKVNTLQISNTDRKINTITLFRDINQPRRKKFLDDLKANQIKFENINNVFENLNQIYLNTKILVNIRQTDHHDTLEELRILAALRCGVIVISEDVPLKEYTRYNEFIIWGSLENLPTIIHNVQSNYENYHKAIFTRRFYKRMSSIELCNSMSVTKSLALMVSDANP